MMNPVSLVGFLIVLAVLWMVVHLVLQSTGRDPLSRQERAELHELRLLVDDLKETAWDHRELDSSLATIIIDKIRAHERRGRELDQ